MTSSISNLDPGLVQRKVQLMPYRRTRRYRQTYSIILPECSQNDVNNCSCCNKRRQPTEWVTSARLRDVTYRDMSSSNIGCISASYECQSAIAAAAAAAAATVQLGYPGPWKSTNIRGPYQNSEASNIVSRRVRKRCWIFCRCGIDHDLPSCCWLYLHAVFVCRRSHNCCWSNTTPIAASWRRNSITQNVCRSCASPHGGRFNSSSVVIGCNMGDIGLSTQFAQIA